MKQKTTVLKENEEKQRWYLIDASGVSLGRLSARVASILRGKNLTNFTPHANPHNHVIVINALSVKVTQKKLESKRVYWHTGYPGGLRSSSYRDILDKSPVKFVERVIKGMLPKNSLGRDLRRNLKIYAGDKHDHSAQKPILVNL